MSKLTLRLMDETFAIHSLPANSEIPEQVFAAKIFFIAKTFEEVSIVLPQHVQLASDDVEKDWRALEVVGPLDFTLTGILSNISAVLAKEKISIFAISTFDTDYILVKNNTVKAATSALQANNYLISAPNL
ncbi:ACT domain-containing protein [Thalassomonas actiniarum]|uniref:ACT domain-containing protein n=1 Tax=Thalassomonas actiniarum TaxID=485447 RepID=A0AAE9YJN9_9GAMM|nr:ACT domain-containing protein [Thalassomonas actiniarum]WDD96975.1 ACT domain-containing protein [Thalassomonas actiniarum]